MRVMSSPVKPAPLSPEDYLLDIFSSEAARTGAVIRRKPRDIERYIGRQAILRKLRRRAYGAVENSDQIFMFCNANPVRLLM